MMNYSGHPDECSCRPGMHGNVFMLSYNVHVMYVECSLCEAATPVPKNSFAKSCKAK